MRVFKIIKNKMLNFYSNYLNEQSLNCYIKIAVLQQKISKIEKKINASAGVN